MYSIRKSSLAYAYIISFLNFDKFVPGPFVRICVRMILSCEL